MTDDGEGRPADPGPTSPDDDEGARRTDRALMAAVAEGDRVAFRVLLRRYWAPLVAYSAEFVLDRDVGQDVVQRTFIQVWKTRDRWTPSSTVNAYLYRITRNLSLNARRDRTLRQERHEGWGRAENRTAGVRTPDQHLEIDFLRREVQGALDQLSERRREVFVLSRFHGLTHREIAEARGTSPQTVSNQLSAALKELRATLSHLLDEL